MVVQELLGQSLSPRDRSLVAPKSDYDIRGFRDRQAAFVSRKLKLCIQSHG